MNKSMFLAALLCGSSIIGYTQEPDNTQTNKRDRNANVPTADQQKENIEDRDLTKKIRRAIIADKSLSTYAHNVKVISQGGAVTLKGPVRSETEKKAIESKTIAIVGSTRKINNELSVKPQR